MSHTLLLMPHIYEWTRDSRSQGSLKLRQSLAWHIWDRCKLLIQAHSNTEMLIKYFQSDSRPSEVYCRWTWWPSAWNMEAATLLSSQESPALCHACRMFFISRERKEMKTKRGPGGGGGVVGVCEGYVYQVSQGITWGPLGAQLTPPPPPNSSRRSKQRPPFYL